MVETLQNITQRWLKSRKHRSLKQLAEECDLNYGTIRNMADGKAAPNGETILRLLLVTCPIDEVHAFAQQHMPHLAPYTKSLAQFGTQMQKAFPVTRKHAEILLEISFGPTTFERLTLKFGPGVTLALDELLNENIIRQEGSHFVMPAENCRIGSQQFAKETLRLILDNLDSNLRGNLIFTLTGALNIEAARRVFEVLEKAQNEIRQIYHEPANKGEHRVAAALATTLY